jgi:hypothetical protein
MTSEGTYQIEQVQLVIWKNDAASRSVRRFTKMIWGIWNSNDGHFNTSQSLLTPIVRYTAVMEGRTTIHLVIIFIVFNV